ncbi:MAG TPA: Lrp/AsnC ligand binding domain-containing protein [Blastocatellia bacterium]|nr:Lrp/AsnC ligand binding domain-containing protein [Blastocatellia bacterium]
MLAFVFLQTIPLRADAAKLVSRIPEVEEVHRVAGEDSYIVRVRVANTEALGRFIRDKIETIKSVSSARTTLVLKTLKDKEPSGKPSVEDARALARGSNQV